MAADGMLAATVRLPSCRSDGLRSAQTFTRLPMSRMKRPAMETITGGSNEKCLGQPATPKGVVAA